MLRCNKCGYRSSRDKLQHTENVGSSSQISNRLRRKFLCATESSIQELAIGGQQIQTLLRSNYTISEVDKILFSNSIFTLPLRDEIACNWFLIFPFAFRWSSGEEGVDNSRRSECAVRKWGNEPHCKSMMLNGRTYLTNYSICPSTKMLMKMFSTYILLILQKDIKFLYLCKP
jgi:hypothetical protein